MSEPGFPPFELGHQYEDHAGHFTVMDLSRTRGRVTIERQGAPGGSRIVEYGMDAHALWAEVDDVLRNGRRQFVIKPESAALDVPREGNPGRRQRAIAPPTQHSESIMDVCRRRNIVELVHFTRTPNMLGILSHGLVPREQLSRSAISHTVNDELRLEGRRDANCLSITLPNWRMFYSLRSGPAKTAWSVLGFDIAVLEEHPCAFSRHNAASSKVRAEDLRPCEDGSKLELMFADDGEYRRQHNLPASVPTDPQAEVLIFGVISPHMIRNVYLEARSKFSRDVERKLDELGITVQVDRSMFLPRNDHRALGARGLPRIPD